MLCLAITMPLTFLIMNSLPLNGGDEALLRALVLSLAARFPTAAIHLASDRLELTQRYLPDLQFVDEHTFSLFETVLAKSHAWLRRRMHARAVERILPASMELLRQADVVISAPGGFLQDRYSLTRRLRGFEVALDLGKPVIVLAQSVGPFWKRRSIRRVRQIFNRLTAITVRDEISAKYLIDCGVAPEKIRVTADIAFLWHDLDSSLFVQKQVAVHRDIGLSFRTWNHGASSDDQTIEKAAALCRHLLRNPEVRLHFLSTCQGIPAYTDDSAMAGKIVQALPPPLASRCHIIPGRFTPPELIRQLGAFEAYIGMRLHGCLLAMLGGTPAMGIGYEDKTEYIFNMLGLSDYQVKLGAEAGDWMTCADRFLGDLRPFGQVLERRIAQAARKAWENLDVIEQCVAGLAWQRKGGLTLNKRECSVVQIPEDIAS
ncbi:MAG: polysaccharide pyruvyl transferase family protein [Armatimonadota bacterium]